MAALPNSIFEATSTDQPFLADEDQLLMQLKSFSSPIPFFQLLIIYFLPYTWRKLILDAYRIRRPLFGNAELHRHALEVKGTTVEIPRLMSNRSRKRYKRSRLRLGESENQYTKDPNEYYERYGRTTISLEDIDDLMQNVYDNSIIMYLLSYFVRAEGTSRVDEFLRVNEELIQKEIKASQQPNRAQELDYTYLFHEEEISRPVHKETELLPFRVRKYVQDFLSSFQHLYGDRNSVNIVDWETRGTFLKLYIQSPLVM